MSKLSSFLRLKVYRRTFLLYLVIVLVAITTLLFVFHSNIMSRSLESYVNEADTAFAQAERQLTSVTSAIDNFFTHLYASSGLRDDFFRFFGSTPVEYVEKRLQSAPPQYATYLDSCNNLVSDSGYCIRHILYYTSSKIVDMEYNASGYSRYQIITPDAAKALCRTGYQYTREIHWNAADAGKVTFIIDVSGPVQNAYGANPAQTVCVIQGDNQIILGNHHYADLDFGALEARSRQGRIYPGAGRGSLLYCAHHTNQFSFSVVSVVPAWDYMEGPFREFTLFTAALLLVFALITMLYVRQFSSDSKFIESILSSIVQAQSEGFQPVEIGKRDDEFASIATHLNGLYEHLNALIQQKYVLTIRQQRTEMQMLSAQLNPHFLYNTLERIRLRALLESNPAVAEAITDLGLLYRNIVKTEPVITLQKELDITRQYLDLMSFLYEDQFLYHLDVPEEIMDISTPKIWMQPIVENFFKHNFQHDSSLKVIVISGERLNGGIRLKFFDNCGKISDEQLLQLNQLFTDQEDGEETSTGIGLQNVYSRLRLFYGSRLEMRIENNKPAGVCIQILLKNEVTS
ncbi:MAG: histidine kinase [Oscillospiraceae bacterium]|nr:histidine kinase [Oscillospiraceae bacterium]